MPYINTDEGNIILHKDTIYVLELVERVIIARICKNNITPLLTIGQYNELLNNIYFVTLLNARKLKKNYTNSLEKDKNFTTNTEIAEFYVDIMRQYIESSYQGWSTKEGWTMQKELAVLNSKKEIFEKYGKFL